MNKQIESLIILHDLDLLFKELSDKKTLEHEKGMGFKINQINELEKTIKNIRKKMPAHLLERYEILKTRYTRVIVPVKDGICYGCFMRLPTSIAAKKGRDLEVSICNNCGRFQYWITE